MTATTIDRKCVCGGFESEHDELGCSNLLSDPNSRSMYVGCPCIGFTAAATNESEDDDVRDDNDR